MRISPKPVAQYPGYLRPFFWNQRQKYGAVLESALLWARAPRLFLGVAFLYGMIDRRSSPLDPALRSLLTVRVSQINHCLFCVDLNSATLMTQGASPDKVEALAQWRESSLFDEREQAALEYAEAMTYTDGGVDEKIFGRLKRHFDDEAIIELTGLVAFQNLSSKFNAALGVPSQGFCARAMGTLEKMTPAMRPLSVGDRTPLHKGAHMKSTKPIVTEPGLRLRFGAALLILRLALGLFLLVWGLEKFIITERSVAIYDYFYAISASNGLAYVLGGLESLLALAIVIGAFRRWSYGIGLLVHLATTVATIRLIVDPWGLISGEPQHLYFAAVPVLAGFIALYLLRDLDYFSFDERRAKRLSRVQSS